MKKKIVSMLLVMCMSSGMFLTACSGDSSDSTETNDTTEETASDGVSTEDSSGGVDYSVDKLDRSDEGYVLIWNDEFDGDSLDTTKWCCQFGTGIEYGLSQWGNAEQQYYTAREENVRVEDGNLIITARKEEEPYEGSRYTSGRLRTLTDDNEELFAVTYGRVEARIKILGGSGIWPAFWMLPADKEIYGEWAASGELDIMEAKGRLPGQVGGTAHFGKTWPDNYYSTADYYFPEGTDIRDYHTYAIEWDPDEIRWYVDDNCYSTLTDWSSRGEYYPIEYTEPAPFDVPFYIILNLAVGGSYDIEGVVTKESFPAEMSVDFVRVFQRESGYTEKEDTINSTEDDFDYDAPKTVLAGKYYLYNGSFNLGSNRLAYWHTENLEADVPSYVIDKDGNADYSRAAILTGAGENGRLYQNGIILESDVRYGVRFSVSTESAADIKVVMTDSEGNILLEQGVTLPEALDKYPLQCAFISTVTDENACFSFYVGDGQTVSIDNIDIMKID